MKREQDLKKRLMDAILSVFILTTLGACNYGDSFSSLGATPGGAQDIGLARDLIERGEVPTPNQFTAEGLYSEHDLTLAESPECDEVLCLGGAAALAPGLNDNQKDLFVQLGMSSQISAADFSRDPLNLGVVIDTSGSMGSSLPHLKTALHTLVDVLHDDDRVAIVVFEANARTILSSTLVSQSNDLHAAIDRLETGGSTNMEAGMKLGYQEIDSFVEEGRLSRLMVLGDAMPNTGNTDAGSFNALTQAAAARDIGFTFFGFGLSFGADFIDELAHLRGANYRFVGAEDVEEIFEEELDFLVTPIAYDLQVSITERGTSHIATYGVPQLDAHSDGSLIDISTVFLSKRKGAIVLRLDGSELESLVNGPALTVVDLNIAYDTNDGRAIENELTVTLGLEALSEETDAFFPSPQIERTVAVTNMFLAMKEACARFHDGSLDVEVETDRINDAIAGLESANQALEDENLIREIELLEKLLENISSAESPINGEEI